MVTHPQRGTDITFRRYGDVLQTTGWDFQCHEFTPALRSLPVTHRWHPLGPRPGATQTPWQRQQGGLVPLAGWGQLRVNAARLAPGFGTALCIPAAAERLKGHCPNGVKSRAERNQGKGAATVRDLLEEKQSRHARRLGACGHHRGTSHQGSGAVAQDPNPRDAATYVPSAPGWSETGADP